jgi:hypothetical protein
MPYVASDGNVLAARERSLFSLSAIPELFWDVVNFVTLFFRTIIDPNLTSRGANYTTSYRPGGSAQPAVPKRRIGGVNRGAGAGGGCPPMGGG